MGASDDDVMFPPGPKGNETTKWSLFVKRFYEKHEIKGVKSHDFRVTQVTNFYNTYKDIVKTQEYVGHSDVRITRRYIKVN